MFLEPQTKAEYEKDKSKEKLQNWKLGNYFRELSIVTAGVFITLAGTDFINSASQEKQINKSMQMIKMELEENLKVSIRPKPHI